ncbi:hypothetical protein BCR37DRAFT_384658 [Protomyces lactucae-debilis]|uniref:Uncharacterized protein n=1 Tax=Protomyces lactucae-debilis TaxID=2754530 RepID=A0A1Y2EQV2_PROLT|nr:uncharacterized protein BCR37DRAFT_384658 [Protomyces lactucae-debilis]ORY73929.1 hypothetical protein BCR37DRAFT_384658 [Protomyces lactucae-debilis]
MECVSSIRCRTSLDLARARPHTGVEPPGSQKRYRHCSSVLLMSTLTAVLGNILKHGNGLSSWRCHFISCGAQAPL